MPHPALIRAIDKRYCSAPECRKARKRGGRKPNYTSGSDYREAQVKAQRQRCNRNPDYWRRDRQRNPEYTERNRQKQQERNRRKRLTAKMDALNLQVLPDP